MCNHHHEQDNEYIFHPQMSHPPKCRFVILLCYLSWHHHPRAAADWLSDRDCALVTFARIVPMESYHICSFLLWLLLLGVIILGFFHVVHQWFLHFLWMDSISLDGYGLVYQLSRG